MLSPAASPAAEGALEGATTALAPELVDNTRRQLQARIGNVVRERWRIDALLGVGGMAAIYGATHRNGRRVALKVLHPELCANEPVKSRFLREAYLANRIPHPGTVAILDDDVMEDGAAFLVMELLEGETVELRWRRRCTTADPAEVLAVMDQVLDILSAAHFLGVVHRDLKPSNLFLTTEGRVKLLDFGIAQLREPSRADTTIAGLSMGTPAYMPPEQARGRWELVDARSDIWALGATMFTVLTGRFVHEADTLNEQLLAAMTVPAPPLRTVAPNVPPAVAAIVDKALAFDRDRRFQDAREMQSAIREAYQQLTGEAVPALCAPAQIPVSPTPVGPIVPAQTTSRGLAGTTVDVRPARRRATGAVAIIGVVMVLFIGGIFAIAQELDRRDVSQGTARVAPTFVDAAARAVLGSPAVARATSATSATGATSASAAAASGSAPARSPSAAGAAATAPAPAAASPPAATAKSSAGSSGTSAGPVRAPQRSRSDDDPLDRRR